MELPGGSDEWLAPSPSPPGPAVPDRHDEHGVGTFIWPPVGTSTWPPVGTFSWPRTPRMVTIPGRHSPQSNHPSTASGDPVPQRHSRPPCLPALLLHPTIHHPPSGTRLPALEGILAVPHPHHPIKPPPHESHQPHHPHRPHPPTRHTDLMAETAIFRLYGFRTFWSAGSAQAWSRAHYF